MKKYVKDCNPSTETVKSASLCHDFFYTGYKMLRAMVYDMLEFYGFNEETPSGGLSVYLNTVWGLRLCLNTVYGLCVCLNTV